MSSKELFQKGCNCAQSVFLPFAIECNIEEETALKLMSPFGGGISSTDNICGALSGGIAAIGLYCGHSEAGDVETKNKCSETTRRFINEFKNACGSIRCTQLVGYNFSQPGEREKAKNADAFNQKCSHYIEKAQALVKKIVEE